MGRLGRGEGGEGEESEATDPVKTEAQITHTEGTSLQTHINTGYNAGAVTSLSLLIGYARKLVRASAEIDALLSMNELQASPLWLNHPLFQKAGARQGGYFAPTAWFTTPIKAAEQK